MIPPHRHAPTRMRRNPRRIRRTLTNHKIRRPLHQRLSNRQTHRRIHVIDLPPTTQQSRRIPIIPQKIPLRSQHLRQHINSQLRKRGSHLQHTRRRRQRNAQRVKSDLTLVIRLKTRISNRHRSHKGVKTHVYTTHPARLLRFSYSLEALTAR